MAYRERCYRAEEKLLDPWIAVMGNIREMPLESLALLPAWDERTKMDYPITAEWRTSRVPLNVWGMLGIILRACVLQVRHLHETPEEDQEIIFNRIFSDRYSPMVFLDLMVAHGREDAVRVAATTEGAHGVNYTRYVICPTLSAERARGS